jgi:hypothetical protein
VKRLKSFKERDLNRPKHYQCVAFRIVGERNPIATRIAPLGDLNYRIPIEIVTKIRFGYYYFLASNLGEKASTFLGAIQFRFRFLRRMSFTVRSAAFR